MRGVCPSELEEVPNVHRRRAGYPPEADHLRLPRHRDRAGAARADRPGRPGAPAGLAGPVRRPRGCRVRGGGVRGWRYVAEELAAAGIAAHLAEPADTAARRGRKRHAKTGKTDARHLRMLLAEGRLPECWIPPGHILECRALLELYNDLRRERTAWAQRIHAVLFHQGAPALGEAALRTDKGVAGLRAAAAAQLSPAGQLQVATALEVIDALGARLHVVRHQLLDAAGTWPGRRRW